MSDFVIIDPRLDHRRPEEFVVSDRPVFSWRIQSSRPGASQKAYRITVRDERGIPLWDSGRVVSGLSAGIPWGARPLRSRQRGSWTLEVWDETGHREETGTMPFEVTLLRNADWRARWIRFSGNNPTVSAPCPYFRKKFYLPEAPIRARLYISARGLFEAYLNGQKAGADRFVPGWTDFRKQVPFLTYDVTSLCQAGDNLIGAILGEGWYCGCGRRKNYYGDCPELLVQLEAVLPDGSIRRVVSKGDWKCTTGPLLYSDIYDGEFYDARLELPGWNTAEYSDRTWTKATPGAAAADSTSLVPKLGEPVREIVRLKPHAVLHPKPDVWIWDIGQNITGYVRVRIGGAVGRLYTIRFGEMLYDDQTLYNLNYRTARSTDYFVFGDNETQWYEPTFTFHGFRYVQIDGFQFSNNRFTVDDVEVEAVVLHSDLEINGGFECGHAKLRKLYDNILWSQRDNFFEIPTDCPQRDERLGWTGDAQVFAAAAGYSMFTLNFLRKYLRDVRDAQRPDGAVASIAPDILRYSYGAAGWADAITIIPWTLYWQYGDPTVLAENFAAMEKWVNFQRRTSDGLIRPKTFYGDHLNFSSVETPSELLGTAYFYHSAVLLAHAAAVLGSTAKSARYRRLAEKIAAAYREKYVDSDGMVRIHSQTALAVSLHFGLLPETDRRRNAALLAKLVRDNGNRLTTGFLGTSCLNAALSANGETAAAFDLYLQEEFPSWLFTVNQGATTMWERWNSYTIKDGFGNPNMNSFNHYAYGAIHAWVVETVCGIRLTAPGGKRVEFCCHPDRRVGQAAGWITTAYGEVSSAWRYVGDDRVEWHISAPANTDVSILIPAGWECPDLPAAPSCGNLCVYMTRSQRNDILDAEERNLV